MTKNLASLRFAGLRRSKAALAIPATFLILFVSTLGLISITYYFAVEKVNARSQTLKMATAKQDFVSLDENLMAVLWQPGSARTVAIADSGGQLHVQPSDNSLTIGISDNRDINETIFNASIGQVTYELPNVESPDTGLFLKGDSRTIGNQSGSLMTQLYIRSGAEHAEILLRYRPTLSYTIAGTEDNKTVNNVRIYVINMNTSEAMALCGKVPLKISCESAQMTTVTHNLSYNPEPLLVTSVLDGASGQVSVPISSTSYGAIVNIEIVQSIIRIERCVR